MRILKIIATVFFGLIAIVLLIAAFLSNQYKVERSITINKQRSEVFDYIKYLKNQNEYSKWAKMDPAMRKVYSGEDGTVGFISAWNSSVKDVGKGAQEIKNIVNNERVDYEIRFEKPMKDVAASFMSTDSTGIATTLVKWQINGKMPYPTNIMGLFMDKLIGEDIEIGLKNLKALQEK